MRLGARDSIRRRLLGLAAIWLTLALIGAYLVMGAVLERFVTQRFDAGAAALADSLLAGLTRDGAGRVVLESPPADPRYRLPLGGWFWQVEQDGVAVLKSPSLFDSALPPAAAPGRAAASGPDGAALRVLTRDAELAEPGAPLRLRVSVPQAEINAALSDIRGPLALCLAVLGLGLAAASVVQVRAGLAALDRMGADLRAVRDGRAAHLPLPPVAELRPVAAELNALIDQNAALVTRAREHLGNLAHSLRTPLAALAGALGKDDPGQALIARMDRQIDWHLRRARGAGTARWPLTRVTVAEVAADLLLVLDRPIRDRGLSVACDLPQTARFAGDRHDLEEMLGNLLDNAVKWAATRIEIRARSADGRLSLTVSDDGAGLAEDAFPQALARGGRLDETGMPGAGLGLAIVSDLAALHGGRLTLGRGTGAMRGLTATLDLPG